MNLDERIFLALNFDGGPLMDRIMLAISGTAMWIPLYALILWLVWRRYGWRGSLLFLVLMAAAVGLADIVAGIFKHNGLLGGLLPDFTPRWRPMFSPELEGLDIAPDSLRVLRRLSPEALATAGLPECWSVHVPPEAVSGRYGTVSAHAATSVALALFAVAAVRRRWFSLTMAVVTLLICYSRIYLGKHFPMDLVWGALVGIVTASAMRMLFARAVGRAAREK